jgi:hypothetical protein
LLISLSDYLSSGKYVLVIKSKVPSSSFSATGRREYSDLLFEMEAESDVLTRLETELGERKSGPAGIFEKLHAFRDVVRSDTFCREMAL